MSIDEFVEMKVDPTVVGVVVGTDYFLNHRNMCEASLYITQNQANIIGMNVDRIDGKDRLRPSGGSIIKMVQSFSGSDDIQIVGKPNEFAFEVIRQEHGLQNESLEKFLMVGDNLSTDILFGNNCGIDTLLVLSGVTNGNKAERILEEARSGLVHEEGADKEGVPTHVMSLLSQSNSINFSKY